jgi:hypothetical protein
LNDIKKDISGLKTMVKEAGLVSLLSASNVTVVSLSLIRRGAEQLT